MKVINVGTTANDGTGDRLRNALIKVNENFEELTITHIPAAASTATWAGIADVPQTLQDIDNLLAAKQDAATAFSGDYEDLDNLPVLFSGEYEDLSGKPVLFSGSYNDLDNLPVLFSGSYEDLDNLPVLFSGNYEDLNNLPTLFDGDYSSLAGIPAEFPPEEHGTDKVTGLDSTLAALPRSISHTDENDPRPTTTGFVHWIGTEEPLNGIMGDTWVSPTHLHFHNGTVWVKLMEETIAN